MFCREQAARFNENLADIEALGARVVAIGNGTAEMATDFVERFGIRFDVYTDPSRKSYEAAGLLSNLTFSASMLKSAWRALRGGHLQGRTKGNPWQQGGVVVLSGTGQPLLVHADTEAGDHASVQSVIDALRAHAA